eukprot:COSAG02_NODE_65422_length_258_cov_0.641509_1_plen_66_part_01
MSLYRLVYAPLSSSLAWPSLGRRFVQHGMSVTNVGYVEHSNSSLDAPAAAAAVPIGGQYSRWSPLL